MKRLLRKNNSKQNSGSGAYEIEKRRKILEKRHIPLQLTQQSPKPCPFTKQTQTPYKEYKIVPRLPYKTNLSIAETFFSSSLPARFRWIYQQRLWFGLCCWLHSPRFVNAFMTFSEMNHFKVSMQQIQESDKNCANASAISYFVVNSKVLSLVGSVSSTLYFLSRLAVYRGTKIAIVEIVAG